MKISNFFYRICNPNNFNEWTSKEKKKWFSEPWYNLKKYFFKPQYWSKPWWINTPFDDDYYKKINR